jgi:hypothetical protein
MTPSKKRLDHEPPRSSIKQQRRADRPSQALPRIYRGVGSNRGHATTDTDIRFKSRFETSGEFHREIPPPTSRSEATVCAVTGGNIAELAGTAFVALLIVLLSVRTIGYRGEQCGGGESVSQSPLKEKAFSTFADQNPRSKLRWKIVFCLR